MFIYILKKVWRSATISSWVNTILRASSFVLVMPFIIKNYTNAEIALILLFFTILRLQMLLDLGFSNTFGRVISYAYGGAKEFNITNFTNKKNQDVSPNLEGIEKIFFTMKRVYLLISLSWFIFLSTIGTWIVSSSIEKLLFPSNGWFAWFFIVIFSSIRLYGVQYTSLLIGNDKIATARKTEISNFLCNLIFSLLIVSAGYGIKYYVFFSQVFILIEVFLKRHFCLNVFSPHIKESRFKNFDKIIFNQIFPKSWRAGIGNAIGMSIPFATAAVFSKIVPTSQMTPYLFAINVVGILQSISSAPFYSKIPAIARLTAKNRTQKQIHIAQNSMSISFFILATGFITLGILNDLQINIFGFNTRFVDPNLWYLLGLASFTEKYGALHIQLYNTTNHILTHIANGVSGIIFIIIIIPCFKIFGLFALPLSQIIAYTLWYDWYSAKKNYNHYELDFNFELKTSVIPFSLILFYISLSLCTVTS